MILTVRSKSHHPIATLLKACRVFKFHFSEKIDRCISVLEFIESAAEKAIKKAEKFLEKGNKEFLDYNFKKAISFYDKGIKKKCRNEKINEDLQKKRAEAKSMIDFISKCSIFGVKLVCSASSFEQLIAKKLAIVFRPAMFDLE